MKYFFFATAATCLFFSCNSGSTIDEKNDSADTASVDKQPAALPKPRQDSFAMDESKSVFKCTRSKTVKEVDKEIKIGNSVMHMKMDNASFSATTDIRIKNGWWFSLDKKADGGKLVLDMKSVTALQIGEDEKIEAGNPGYLETKKYPTALLAIKSFDSIPGKPGKMQVTADLTIKDTTAGITFPAKLEFANASHPEVPTRLAGNFHIDGVKWGLNPENAKVIKDDLAFDVVLVTRQ